MKTKLILTFFLSIFLISIVIALDAQLPQCFGLDEELIICNFDEQLIFLSGGIPSGPGPGGGGGIVTPPGLFYTHISLDIFGTNIGDYPVTDIKIINASPLVFKEALPLNFTQLLAVGETNKLLWNSSLIEVEPLINYSQPITFWLNISGVVEVYTFYEQTSIDLTIEPYEEESGTTPGFAAFFPDFSFLEERGFTREDTIIIKWILGIMSFLLVIYFIRRRIKEKQNKKRKEKEKEENIFAGVVKKKEKKSYLIDILIILGIIILILLILFIPIKEEKIGAKMAVHYYKNGVEVTLPTAESLSLPIEVSPKEWIITPET